MARQYTNQLLEMVDDGIIDPQSVLNMCLKYMPEDEVREMMEMNELLEEEEE
jgi:hypothetical protein